ncbi:hypothetical protein ARAF_1544 [Arsenophonus endosymbiont of Aleurodicus floccissimus]|uniref:ribosome biogenesis factor YjgA n=1 Tax=Arsenophonus endosymbiont of Aleurodicus floccissimus TaxID=2152761 RepID=UPI000E6B0CF9|nr:ribosome biogenesis factor YjgA [Arsenophonus endosymbiont of Aleurodicus floccissimus]SPP31878.1 hypothetical protein ARAF_1544 [Arsenophonus endosymbiont of Aleurodicus floccissimus]
MAKQPDNWFDDNADKDEIIWVSKSEIKRDAQALKKLGAELVELSKHELERIPLNDELLAAVELAQKIKREGRRRQLQFIGKLLRAQDHQPIYEALDKLKNRHNKQIAILHKLEALRNQLLKNGDNAIEDVIRLFPLADLQQLRTLIRNCKKEREANKPAKAYRQLFQYLKTLSESA